MMGLENLDCHNNCKNWLLCDWPHKIYEDEMVNTPGLEWCWNKLNECNQRVLFELFFLQMLQSATFFVVVFSISVMQL